MTVPTRGCGSDQATRPHQAGGQTEPRPNFLGSNNRPCKDSIVPSHNLSGELWFRRSTRTSLPKWRLLCFPYAGGSARVFRKWHDWFAPDAEVVAIELPGRGFHMRSPLIDNLDTLIEQLVPAIEPLLDLPFALFGHSMGALIAFELCRALRRAGGQEPVHLFLSAMCAPHVMRSRQPAHVLPQDEFLAMLRDLNGTPRDVLDDRGLLKLFLPILRADFRLAETYSCIPEKPLSQPVTVFGGLADPSSRPECLSEWQLYTTGDFSLRLFDGDHFFLHHYDHVMTAGILKSISPAAAQAAGSPFVVHHQGARPALLRTASRVTLPKCTTGPVSELRTECPEPGTDRRLTTDIG